MIRPLSLLLLLAAAPVSHAAALIAPDTANYVSPLSDTVTFGPFGPDVYTTVHTVADHSLGTVSLTNVINGSGLSGVPNISNYTTITHASPSFSGSPANAWSSIDPGAAGGDFFPDFAQEVSGIDPQYTPAGYLDFTFITPVDLTALVTWAYTFNSGFNGNNVSKWRIETFDNDYTLIGSSDFDGPGSMLNGEASTISFGTTYSNVSRVHAYPLDNYFDAVGANGGDRIGIAELRFIAGSPVPEPTTSAVGLLSLGLLASRRRR